jgi:uncharacterized protein YprB with RNaseH-like and TPR domain
VSPESSGFGRALDQLRRAERPTRLSISDPLRLLGESSPAPESPPAPPLATVPLPDGTETTNSAGSHYVVRNRYAGSHFHGRVRLDRADVTDFTRLLDLAGCEHRGLALERIAFLDTETTGISGGAGMCPFLIGVGFYRGDSFEVVQYFIRDFDEETSMLLALGDLLKSFDLLVTYNGRSFDAPLVENRCVLSRFASPFEHMAHFDLLFTARRLWRAGHGSCKLTALEVKILDFVRGPDIPGAQIPRAYFDYLRSSDAITMRTVFSHHVYDILSLAAMMIHGADRVNSEPLPHDEPLDLYSLGRIFDRVHDLERTIRFFEMSIDGRLPMSIRIRVMERLSVLYRKTGQLERSKELCGQLMVLDEFSMVGYEGAAIFQERHARDLEAACSVIRSALGRLDGKPGMARRSEKLQSRLNRLGRIRERKPNSPDIPFD